MDSFSDMSGEVAIGLAVMRLHDAVTQVIANVDSPRSRPYQEVCDELLSSVYGSSSVTPQTAASVMILNGQPPLDVTCAILCGKLDAIYLKSASQTFDKQSQEIDDVFGAALQTIMKTCELSRAALKALHQVLGQITEPGVQPEE